MSFGYKSILVPLYGKMIELSAVDFASALTRGMQAEATVLYLSRILRPLPEDPRRRYLSMVDKGDLSKAMALLDDIFDLWQLRPFAARRPSATIVAALVVPTARAATRTTAPWAAVIARHRVDRLPETYCFAS